MKILMTGYTATHCRIVEQTPKFIGPAAAFLSALQLMGHEVDNKTVVVNKNPDPKKAENEVLYTDLGGYDRIMVGYYSATALGSHRGLVLSPVLGEMLKAGDDRIRFYVDDWHVYETFIQSRPHRKWSNVVRMAKLMNHEKDLPFIEAHFEDHMFWFYDTYVPKHMRILNFVHPWAMFKVPAMERKMKFGGGMAAWDPTPALWKHTGPLDFYKMYKPVVSPEDKVEQWICPSRYNTKEWAEGLTGAWPIVRFGHRRSGTEWVETEKELVEQVYAGSWGILMNPYPDPTITGMWRARYMHAAVAQSVMMVNKGDLEGMSCPAPFDVTRAQVEQMTIAEREQLVLQQSEAYSQMSWTARDVKKFIEDEVL